MLEHAWLIPTIPILAFAFITLFELIPRSDWLCGRSTFVLSTAAVGASFVFSAEVLRQTWMNDVQHSIVAETTWVSGASDGIPSLTVGVLIDPLSSLMMVIVSLVAFLVLLFSKEYMNDEGETGLPRYYASLSLFTGSMLAFVVAPNILMAFIFFELIGLCSYLLIGFWYEKSSAASASKKAFLITRFGDYFFLVGVVAIFAAFTDLSFGANGFAGVAMEMIESGEPVLGLPPETGVTLIALLVLGGVIGKSAQFPLHTWLPDAMEGPTTVSALIHAATMVAAGVYLVARMFDFYALSPDALLVIALLGGFTALFAATMALVVDGIKEVLAYSTISQYGYMMLALGAGGYTAAVFHLMNHAFFKALLFLGAGSVIVATHHTKDMWRYGGLKENMSITYISFLVGSLALAGIVPFSGFWSKDEVLMTAYSNASSEPLLWIAFAMGAVGVLVTGYYTFRMVALTFHGEPRSDYAEVADESGLFILVPLLVLGVLSAVTGFLNAEPLGLHMLHSYLGGEAFKELVGVTAGYTGLSFNPAVTAVSLLLALTGAVAGYRRFSVDPERKREELGALHSVLERRYYIDDAQNWFANKVVLGFSGALNKFDLGVIDGLVNAANPASFTSGGLLRRIQSGVVSHYAAIISLGALLIILAALLGGWLL